MICGFACENDIYDAGVYHALLELELGHEVARWPSQMVITGGWPRVKSQLPLFLANAADAGVRHVLVGIDNDGGLARHPPHEHDHDPVGQAAAREGCRWCAVTSWVPATWAERGGKACMVVPVQTIETWILALKGHDFEARPPEHLFHRPTLKKLAYGEVHNPSARLELARALLSIGRERVRAVLGQRPSYRQFQAQLASWR